MKLWNQIIASLHLPPRSKIDARIRFEMGSRVVSQLKVYRRELPTYRFVDVYRATEEYSRAIATLRFLSPSTKKILQAFSMEGRANRAHAK